MHYAPKALLYSRPRSSRLEIHSTSNEPPKLDLPPQMRNWENPHASFWSYTARSIQEETVVLSETLVSPAGWEAASARPTLELLAALQALSPSPLRDARLAYAQLMLGRLAEADLTLQPWHHEPLARAVWMAVLIEQHQFQQVETLGQDLPAGGEARARVLLEMAKAKLHLYRFGEGAGLAQEAARAARSCGLERLAVVCELLAEECQTSQNERFDLAEREAKLRAFAAQAPSQEAQVMAYMCLVRLISRQGLYDKALRYTLDVPRDLNGRHFVELMLVLNGLDNDADWAGLHPWYWGRLHAIKGLLTLDPGFILSGPPPTPEFHPRPFAEWATAFGWAHLKKGNPAEALHYFQASYVPKAEWDLRLVRDLGLLELLFEARQSVLEGYNLGALVTEALWLVRERINPQSVILRLIPQAMPYATALLLATPGGAPALTPHAAPTLLFASPKGLTLAGVTHANTRALVRLLEEDTAGMSPAALRTNRHRLGLFLRQLNQPTPVRATRVLEVLHLLAEHTQDSSWELAALNYAREYGF